VKSFFLFWREREREREEGREKGDCAASIIFILLVVRTQQKTTHKNNPNVCT
jgi:hypothetical protein